MASHYILCKKNHSTKHFNKYKESIIVCYGLWCKVFGTSKVQYVMVTQNLFMKFIQCDHITCYFIFWSPFHVLFIHILFHGPWLIIQRIMLGLCTPPYRVFTQPLSITIQASLWFFVMGKATTSNTLHIKNQRQNHTIMP